MIYPTPAGGDDEVGGQGRGREGRGPGVLLHDDGGHEEAARQQTNWSSSQVELLSSFIKHILSYSVRHIYFNKLNTFFTFWSDNNDSGVDCDMV